MSDEQLPPPAPDILTPSDVAALFAVDPKTVTRWADTGRIDSFRTLGGHRRFRRTDVDAALVKAGVTV